jgi:hypothetical protein
LGSVLRVLYSSFYLLKGPSTRPPIRERIAVRFRARFAAKRIGVLMLYHTPSTTVCEHISENIEAKSYTVSYVMSNGISFAILVHFLLDRIFFWKECGNKFFAEWVAAP